MDRERSELLRVDVVPRATCRYQRYRSSFCLLSPNTRYPRCCAVACDCHRGARSYRQILVTQGSGGIGLRMVVTTFMADPGRE